MTISTMEKWPSSVTAQEAFLEMSLFKVLIVKQDHYRIRGTSATYANEHLIHYTTHTYILCAAFSATGIDCALLASAYELLKRVVQIWNLHSI